MKITIISIAGKEYGIDISQIREVIRMRNIMPVPDSAQFVEGVISMHGRVVPIVNLRKKMKFETAENAVVTGRIIIARINSHMVGLIVDDVLDVIDIDEGSIAPPDEVLKDAEYLTGVVQIKKRLVLIADIEKLLSADTKSSIEKLHERIEVRKKE